MKCETCGEVIPSVRLRAMPGTIYCVKCSPEEPVGGVMDVASKNDAVLIVVSSPSVARSMSRRGFHAFLGAALQSYNNPRIIQSDNAAKVVHNLSEEIKVKPAETEMFDVVNRNKARCHPERPRINSRGDCAECAIAWYNKRRPQ